MPAENLAQKETTQPVEPTWTCVTCGANASGDYCSQCGEKHVAGRDISFAHLGAEALEAFFHLDSKLLLTLRTLFLQPGRLTADFFLGRRKPFMAPLQTFLVCNLIFFVLQPLTGLEILAPPLRVFNNNAILGKIAQPMIEHQLARKQILRTDTAKMEEFTRRFNQVSHLQAKSLVVLMSPLLACVLALLYLGRRRFYSEHLIFALHGYAWWMLWLLIILISMALLLVTSRAAGSPISLGAMDELATLLEFGGFGLYLGLAMQRFYRQSVAATVARAVPLAFATFAVFHLYRVILLFTILYAM